MICDVCHHKCDIKEGGRGFCKARTCRDGEIVPLNYGALTAVSLDPIEKKPLVGYMPGTMILSISSWGCNMTCPWCQNDHISRGPCERVSLWKVEDVVKEAVNARRYGNIGIAFTYNEPLISPEFMLDTMILSAESGLKNVIVTNGMINENRSGKLLSYTDALNIDLKTFSEEKYRKIGGDLKTVLDFIKKAAKAAHVEITMPLVPGFNDSYDEIDNIAGFIADIDPEIILHISRIFPAGDMPFMRPTQKKLVYEFAERAGRVLKTVRTGNC